MNGPNAPEAVLIATMGVLAIVTITACCIKSINSPSTRGAAVWGGVVLAVAGITLVACLVTSPVLAFAAK